MQSFVQRLCSYWLILCRSHATSLWAQTIEVSSWCKMKEKREKKNKKEGNEGGKERNEERRERRNLLCSVPSWLFKPHLLHSLHLKKEKQGGRKEGERREGRRNKKEGRRKENLLYSVPSWLFELHYPTACSSTILRDKSNNFRCVSFITEKI